MTAVDSLAWRVERVCHLSWPSLREEAFGDWIFRFAAGHSRRANSVNAQRPVSGDIGAVIATAEAHYHAASLPTIFRVTSLLDPAIEASLCAQDYTPEGETLTLYGDFVPWPMRRDPDVTIAQQPDAAWLAAMSALQGHSPVQSQKYREILGYLGIPAAFAALRINGAIVAMAYGCFTDGLLCLNSVITAEDQRGRGFGSRLLGAVMAWAIEQGASGVCLPVEAENHIAQKLYRNMGLTRELYRYRYWRGKSL